MIWASPRGILRNLGLLFSCWSLPQSSTAIDQIEKKQTKQSQVFCFSLMGEGLVIGNIEMVPEDDDGRGLGLYSNESWLFWG